MRFIIDECTGPAVAQWLRSEYYEVFSVFDEQRGMADDAILHKAFTEDWIVITNDKDFGEKVYRERQPHRGIIFLRLADERSVNKINVLQRLLANHISQLANKFVVVTERHVRFANP